MSSEKASLEPRHTSGNIQSAGHEVLARHTATQGPMQGAEEFREASCSEPANVALAELGGLIVMNPPFLVLSSVSVWHGHGCFQAAHKVRPRDHASQHGTARLWASWPWGQCNTVRAAKCLKFLGK